MEDNEAEEDEEEEEDDDDNDDDEMIGLEMEEVVERLLDGLEDKVRGPLEMFCETRPTFSFQPKKQVLVTRSNAL